MDADGLYKGYTIDADNEWDGYSPTLSMLYSVLSVLLCISVPLLHPVSLLHVHIDILVMR